MEAIQREIKEQMEMGDAELLEEDHLMLEVNLGDMETTTGEQEEYWLVAISAAWAVAVLAGQRSQTMQHHIVRDGH